jgi:asparagine synthase (glutamine-hydrolysing)
MNTTAIRIPRFSIEWDKAPGPATLGTRLFEPGTGLRIGVDGYRPEPAVAARGDATAIVFGAPVVGETVDLRAAAESLLADGPTDVALRRLDGQFLVVHFDGRAGKLSIVGDRFNGVSLYYADLGNAFVATNNYIDLVRRIRARPGFKFDGKSMWTYVCLQRVMGATTHDNLSRYLLPATRLELSANHPAHATRYWRPDFAKRQWTEAEAGERFVGLLGNSLVRRTRDKRRYGLFLSGGHDSRVVATAFPVPFTAFTVAFSDNYEVDCARRIAAALGAPFRYLQLPQDQYSETLDAAAELCGGMYSVDNALFLGLDDAVGANADVVFHGHGLDYMFHGMYVPSRWITLFGRPTFFRKLTPLGDDLVSAFVGGVPYRLKYLELGEFVLPHSRVELDTYTNEQVASVLRDGEDVCRTNADRWEYLITHALGRHYSAPNILSKATCAEQRTPTFDNELFDFFLSLPPELRIYGQTLRLAMRNLAPAVARIPTGNWGMPAAAGPWTKTAWLVARKALRHATGITGLRAPTLEDRTWPDRDTYLASHPKWQSQILAAVTDGRLVDAMPFLDWSKIRARAPEWVRKPDGAAGLLVSLLSLQRFLALAEES